MYHLQINETQYQELKNYLEKRQIKVVNKKDHSTTYSTAFETFWKEYPLKKGKKATEKAFFKIIEDVSLETLTNSIKQQKKEKELKLRNKEFVPDWKHPLTWLNQGCWEDEISIQNIQSAQPTQIIRNFEQEEQEAKERHLKYEQERYAKILFDMGEEKRNEIKKQADRELLEIGISKSIFPDTYLIKRQNKIINILIRNNF